MMTAPELKKAQEGIQTAQGRGRYWRQQYLESLKNPRTERVDWEQSPQHKQWQSEVQGARDIAAPFAENIRTTQAAMQYGVPFGQVGQYLKRFGKGGSFKEKVALEKFKQKHKKELLKDKQLLKKIMENNKLMQKALIKVFK